MDNRRELDWVTDENCIRSARAGFKFGKVNIRIWNMNIETVGRWEDVISVKFRLVIELDIKFAFVLCNHLFAVYKVFRLRTASWHNANKIKPFIFR